MSDTVEKKKKLYKVATELNLSHETLIEFLRKKGHEVKSHMSSVDEPMMRDILIHFKRDKDVAEKHQRKIQEIRETKKRAERKAVEEHAEPAGKGAAAEHEVKAVTPEAEPVTAELESEVTVATEVSAPDGAPSAAGEPAAGQEAIPAEEPVAEEAPPFLASGSKRSAFSVIKTPISGDSI